VLERCCLKLYISPPFAFTCFLIKRFGFQRRSANVFYHAQTPTSFSRNLRVCECSTSHTHQRGDCDLQRARICDNRINTTSLLSPP
jgi:hypothetical protein